MAADGSAFGIVAAHLGGGAARHLLELRGVPTRNELKPGTMVVSSGLGSVFPRGVPIGTVIGEQQSPEQQWARTYLIRPAVLPSDVGSVMILLPERGTAGVEAIWRPQIDSAELARIAREPRRGGDTTQAGRAALTKRRADSLAAAGTDSVRPRRPRPVRRDTTPAVVPPRIDSVAPVRPDTSIPAPPPA